MTTPGLAEPQQERSRRSFAKVREAALQLLLERGGAGFTLADVSSAAAVSVGTIYGRVGNKATLLQIIQNEELDRIDSESAMRLADAAAIDAPFDESVQEIVTAMVEPLAQNAAMIRAFMRLGDEDTTAASRGSRSWENGRDAFCEALLTVTKRNQTPASPETVAWCHEVVYSVTARQLGFGLTPGGSPESVIATEPLEHSLGATIRLILRG